MVKIKKTQNIKSWQRYGKTGTPICCWWECKLYNNLKNWPYLLTVKRCIPYDPVIPLLGIYPTKMYTNFYFGSCAFVTVAFLWYVPCWPSPPSSVAETVGLSVQLVLPAGRQAGKVGECGVPTNTSSIGNSGAVTSGGLKSSP